MLQTGDNYGEAMDESIHNMIQGWKDQEDLEIQMSAAECQRKVKGNRLALGVRLFPVSKNDFLTTLLTVFVP